MGIAVLLWLLNALGKEYISQINYPIEVVYELSSKKKEKTRKNTK